MMMPFEWDVRVSSKDHTVTASTSCDEPATARYTTLWGTTCIDYVIINAHPRTPSRLVLMRAVLFFTEDPRDSSVDVEDEKPALGLMGWRWHFFRLLRVIVGLGRGRLRAKPPRS